MCDNFSSFIVYVDESGHAAPDPDPNYPCFVLALCLFEKNDYCRSLAPALQELKFRFFGHDMAVMHEREIRKSLGPFSILKDKETRAAFFEGLNQLMEKADFAVISKTIGLARLKPEQPNRAYETLKKKKFNPALEQSEFRLTS